MVILRAGLYERVSTDEQSKYGYSVRAQIDALEAYCKDNKIKIVDHYTDEGVSGGKAAFRRPQMSRLLNDVQEGKIDIVLFTRLDRWFRNTKEYFKVQEILEANKVGWKAIHEDYDTTTANGELAITIFLAIAQNERQKGAERVSAVFESKRNRKECWFGGSNMPFGYAKEQDEAGIMRMVKNPELEEALSEFWDMAVKYENVSKAAKYVNMKYGLNRTKKSWFDVVRNEIYTGKYRQVEDFCPAYVSHEGWKKLNGRNVKKAQQNRVYLFTGLLRCPLCGIALSSAYCTNAKGVEYYRYRCRHRALKLCDYNCQVSELIIEKWLLDNLKAEMENEVARVEIAKAKPKPKSSQKQITALKERLRRLEVVYMAGNKADDEYLSESAEIKELIRRAEQESGNDPAERDLSIIKETLETDFETIYKGLNREDKRRFWRALIKEIHLDGNAVKSVDFF